jgi:DNA-binding phage protein
MDTNEDASKIILQAILDAERSQQWVAEKSGIPATTLRRKLQGQSDFYLAEVANIAQALNLTPSELLPSEFRPEVIA